MNTFRSNIMPKPLLKLASIALLLGLSLDVMAELRQFEMTIEEMELEVAPGFKSKVWGFNGQVPGPLFHVNEGDEVEVTVHNFTTLNHTVHWHGMWQTHSWESDGVPGVTQAAIQPGESYTYSSPPIAWAASGITAM
jgi:manganese oxidase